MKRYIALVLAFAWLGALESPSLAQQSVSPCTRASPTSSGCTPVSPTSPLPVTGSFSATTSGFNWQSSLTPITAATSSVTSGAFTAGKTLILSNTGSTNTAYCKLGATATTAATPILPGQSVSFTSVAETTFACITSTSTTTVSAQVGEGLPTGWGGSGSGSGGAVTIASGAVASGAYSSGSLASGSISAGAMVDLLTMRGTKAAGTAAANSLLAGGVYNATPLTLTDGQQASLQLNANGALQVDGGSADNTINGTTSTGSIVQGVAQTAATSCTSGNNCTFSLDPTTRQLRANVSNPYPIGATPITASATGTTGATTATLAGTSGKTTYICGYSIRANATAATTVTNTITGVVTATLSSIMWVAPLASGLGIDEQIFSPCIPASGTNQAIAIVSGAPGSGGNVSSKGWGYQL